ncbi:hypothetical protein CAEBREN_18306 [Caenorhabditis brenneri]|uniref:F-box domain-containing protein n=1 Tax=Caenorhabditis brenneri TaxID=135651 RepID=G0P3G5_CAEBE|nr:hypothetical protein CAEBREN_18306 [Caenorhabditis brenneri]
MAEVFETNEIAYRACILYEAVRQTPVEDAYKNMKEVKPNVEYSEFEYWYYRFFNGQHDLNHDRNTDLGLSDMPMEVADNIVGYLGLEDKLSTRKVCRNMRAVIDNQASKFDRAVLSISDKFCDIFFDSEHIRYSSQKNRNYLLATPRKKMSLKGDHSIAAIEEFASVITHPKWSFDYLLIGFDEEDSHPENERKSVIFLNSLLSNNKFHVKFLSIDAHSFEPLAILLPHFEADKLEFECFSPMNDTNLLEVIVKMDQWKKVKEFHAGSLPDEFSIEVLFHARECYAHVKLTEDRLVKIRDILFKTSTFDRFVFHDEKEENREEHTVLVDRVMGAHDAYDPETKVYRIENSNDHIQISIKESGEDHSRSVYIERIRS